MGEKSSTGGMAALFTTALGAGISASGQREVGKSQKALMDYNAAVADMRAEDSIVRGRETEFRLRRDAKGMIGASRAAFAAAGVDVSDVDSTASNVAGDIAALSEVDALTIRANAAREAWGHRVSASDLRARGEIAKQEGDMKAIGTITSTAGSVLYQKYGFGSTSRVRT